VDAIKLWFWSLFVFVAWLLAADGWLRLVAFIWLAYPVFVLTRFVRRRRRSDPG